MTETHSKYSPSQLTRIIGCPGSVGATEGVLKTSSSYAQEGTNLHSAVEECFNLGVYKVPVETKKKLSLNKEHVEAVQEVLDWIQALNMKYVDDESAYALIEHKVSLEAYSGPTGCEALRDVGGTLDYSFISPLNSILYVADWKFGKGVEVFPDTAQLKAYALGRIAHIYNLAVKTKTESPYIDKVVLVILQPRLYSGEPVKVYETTPNDLHNWMIADLIPALNNAESKHPVFRPSESTCKWCAVKPTCKYRKDLAMESAAEVFKLHAKIPDKTDEQEVAEFLTRIPDLKQYISDIEDYAMACVLRGKSLPGFKLVAGRSTRQWKDEQAAMAYYYAKTEYDTEELTITKFKSPTQIEKVVGKKNMTAEDWDLVTKPEGKPTLVPVDDKRPPLDLQTVEDKFACYVEE